MSHQVPRRYGVSVGIDTRHRPRHSKDLDAPPRLTATAAIRGAVVTQADVPAGD